MRKTAHKNHCIIPAAVAGLLAAAWGGVAQADPNGTWKRPNGDIVQVSTSGGLRCRIVKGSQTGFEMCHGMAKTGASSWAGSKMKHPDMPGIMTFNGTVTESGASISIKGCAIGQSLCDAETWSRVK